MDDELGLLKANTPDGTIVTISADGAINAKGKTSEIVKKGLMKFILEVFRSEECSGCEVCLSHCKKSALMLNQYSHQIEIDMKSCSKCAECHNRCPVIKFGHRDIEELFSIKNNI